MQQHGYEWFEKLLKQNPTWVRGTQTPATVIAQSNRSESVTFTSSVGLEPSNPLNISFPAGGAFVSWPQYAGILRDAPHPEAAKLLHNYILSEEYQNTTGTWSVRDDLQAPGHYPSIMNMPGTNPAAFAEWMANRAEVEILKNFFESRIGTAQGLSPLLDDI